MYYKRIYKLIFIVKVIKYIIKIYVLINCVLIVLFFWSMVFLFNNLWMWIYLKYKVENY